MQKVFSTFQFSNGFMQHLQRGNFPSYLSSWDSRLNPDGIVLQHFDTHYGYVFDGAAFLKYNGMLFTLPRGMFFCAPGDAVIQGGRGIVISREEYNGMFMVGGPVERFGRLRYIDGCTDSLLVPPVMLGDPCLNLLYFPPGIDQTPHTHPTDRIGMVLSGVGRCNYWTPPRSTGGAWMEQEVELEPGMIFCIHAEGRHKFATPYGKELRVLAYHPDSDYGPTHEFHPMLNRTMVDGVSAKDIPDIRTTEDDVARGMFRQDAADKSSAP